MNEHVVALMLNEIEKYFTDGCWDDDCNDCIWWDCKHSICNLENFEKNLKEILP